jgi:hypothetical protein
MELLAIVLTIFAIAGAVYFLVIRKDGKGNTPPSVVVTPTTPITRPVDPIDDILPIDRENLVKFPKAKLLEMAHDRGLTEVNKSCTKGQILDALCADNKH